MDLIPQLVVNGLVNGSHYALLGIGFGLIFGTTRVVHFAYGPIYAWSAYALWATASLLAWPIWAAFPAGVLAGAVIGMASYLVLYRPFERQRAPLFVVLIASLGAYIVLENLIGLAFGTDTKVVEHTPPGILFLGPAIVTGLQITQFVAFLVIAAALWLFLNRTTYGKAILAMTDNPDMARVIGIDTVKVSILVFGLGSAIAGVAAGLIIMKDGGTPAMGFVAVFYAFIAVVVGGVGSMRGAILGGFLIGMVENLGMISIDTEWQSTIAFVVLVLVLIFRPSGLFKGT